MEREMTKPPLAGANTWSRPEPGPPCVFLSFHRNDGQQALKAKKLLSDAGIEVVSYDPDELWPDGPMEMLSQIVTECHCVLYVGGTSNQSRFVRFEKSIAREFHISVLRAKAASEVPRLIPKIRAIAAEPARSLWPTSVSAGIDSALEQLNADDFAASRVVETGRTGFDIGLDRVTGHHLRQVGNAIHEGRRGCSVL
jgi:hypothetical protein